MKSIADITNRHELADCLGVPLRQLTLVLYGKGVDSYYSSFAIPKKNGGTRCIHAPSGALKELQTKLALRLQEHQIDSWKEQNLHPNLAHAFIKGKSIITNAKVHRNKRYILNIDLQDFFDSFHFGRVEGFFEKNKSFTLPREVAIIIAQLSCYQGHLPQGSPCSPIITNLICQILDRRILVLSKEYGLGYSRYADDLTFSTNRKDFPELYHEFYEKLESIIKRSGFKVNEKKTHLQYRDSRQMVTGLVVNRKISIPHEYYRNTRAMVERLITTGKFDINGQEGTLDQLEGRFSFIDQVDKYNNAHDGQKHGPYQLNGREKQYRAFLFLKHFLINNRPLLFTEGKTDILYLKAALKSMYIDYPNLIEKNSEDKYVFKIKFLHRSKKMEYLLNLSLDGASAMQNLYRFYRGIDNQPDYYHYFIHKAAHLPLMPVLLLFDNETAKKPLAHFINFCKLPSGEDKTLRQKLFVPLTDSNLYLVTNPLVKGKAECEIEDLFPDSTLGTIIDGKIFDRKNEDLKTTYGKDTFSKYVAAHYSAIDFSDFRPMLDAINNAITEYSNTTKGQ